jgi:hypothetical protein
MAKKAGSDRARREALDKALKGMFGKLQGRPTPDRLMSVVEQLDENARPQRKKAGNA